MDTLESFRAMIATIDKVTLQTCLGRLDGALFELAKYRKPRLNELRRTIRVVRREVEGELVKRYAVEAAGEIVEGGQDG